MTGRPDQASPFAQIVSRAAPAARRNVAAMLQDAAETRGDRRHITIGSQSLSFVQARDHAAAQAGLLAASGIKRGDRIALMCANRIECLTMLYGCFWLGAVVVPINIALRGAQLAHAIRLSSPRVLVVDGAMLQHLQPLEPFADSLDILALDKASIPAGFKTFEPPAHASPYPLQSFEPGDPGAILFTSGTTGPSKGALCPMAQFYWWAQYQTAAMSVDAQSVIYNPLPLFHINALNSVTQSLLTGARCVIGQRFSASRFWQEAAQAGATHSAIIGAMADILLAQPDGPWDRAHPIRTVLASSVRADTWATLSSRFGIPRRVGGYGSTETNLVFNSDDGWETQGNMGFAANGFEAQVVDEQDNPLADGSAGELVVRSHVPFAFALGYWGMPDATVSAWRNLWFHTGDRVVRNRDGRFRFVGRLKESIRRRGENISAWEVEQALLGHPSIAEAAVYGVEAALGDEEVMATLVLRAGASLNPAELIAFLEPRLAKFAIPRFIDFGDTLPLTDTGKIRRGELKARGVSPTTWDREQESPTRRR